MGGCFGRCTETSLACSWCCAVLAAKEVGVFLSFCWSQASSPSLYVQGLQGCCQVLRLLDGEADVP